MCDGTLERDSSAPFYPTMVGGLRLLLPSPGAPAGTLRETAVGRVERSAIFRCVPGPTRPGWPAHRVIVQMRTGVSIELRSVEGPAVSFAEHGMVALGAFSDEDRGADYGRRDGPPYTWVQTGTFLPARATDFDGSGSAVGHRPDPAEVAGFEDRGGAWWVDSNTVRANSARYAAAGTSLRPLGHGSGEIVYDSIAVLTGYGDWLHQHPNARSIEASVHFRTYLYRRPGGYHGIHSLDPLVVVEWQQTQTGARETPGGPVRTVDTRTRVLWILENPIEPVNLDDAIRSYRFR